MRYKEYKKVDIPWLDEVPSHWNIVRLNNLASFRTGGTPKNNEGISYDGNVNWITPGDFICTKIDDSKYKISVEAIEENNYKLFPEKSILLVCIASVGKVAIIDKSSYSNQQITAIMPRLINPEFLLYYMISIELKLKNDSAKNVVPILNTSYLKNIYTFAPPKEEQEQIARFLDWKINEIDRLISTREKQIKNLERTRRILIIDTMLNNDYKGVMLGRCASENKRKNTNSNQNLLSLSYGKIIRKDIHGTFGLLPEKFDKYQLVEKGNIVLRLTDLQNDHKSLRVGLVEETGIITSAYIGLICNNSVIPEYLYYYLNAMDLRKDFYSMGAGVRQNLNYNELRKINIKLPDKDKQKYIIDYLNESESNIKKIIKVKEKQINNLKQVKQSLIFDVVTGKIDVRNISIPEYDKVSDIEDDTILEESLNEEV